MKSIHLCDELICPFEEGQANVDGWRRNRGGTTSYRCLFFFLLLLLSYPLPPHEVTLQDAACVRALGEPVRVTWKRAASGE